MFKKLVWRLKEWVIHTICSYVVIGGHCGCCGKWVDNCLVPEYWRITICEECINEGGEE